MPAGSTVPASTDSSLDWFFASPCFAPLRLLFAWTVICAAASTPAAEPAASQPVPDKVDFNRDIRPILSNQCAKCHGPDAKERKGGTDGLRLDVREAAVADLGGYAAIVPGHPEKSALVERIRSSDDEERMPPKGSGKKLTPREIELLTRWVAQGAAPTRLTGRTSSRFVRRCPK